MKRLVLIFVFLLAVHSSTAQSFTKVLFDNCFVLLEEGDSIAFEAVYPHLFVAYVKDMTPYREVLKAVEREDFDNAFLLLDEVTEEDVLIPEVMRDPALSSLRAQPGWHLFSARVDSMDRHRIRELRDELLEMQYTDQSIRLLMQEANKRYGSQNAFGIRERMKRIDRQHAERMQEIIDRYGWLGADEVGDYGSQTLFLVIQHVEDWVVQEKYLPVLEQAVREGKADPGEFAFLTDRLRMNRGEKQVYGTQKIIRSHPAESFVVPLEDPDRVDERRRQVGLDPLSEDLEEYGMEWDVEDYKARLPEIEQLYKQYIETRD